MPNKKMYGGTIEFDQINKAVIIPSGSTFKISSTALTSTAAELNTLHSSSVSNADLIKLHAITATAAQLNSSSSNNVIASVTGAGALVAGTSAINSAAGIALTLPAATGSGAIFRCVIVTTITSLTTTITTNSGDYIAGLVIQEKIGTGPAYYAANGTSHHIITMDGSTKGGIIGDYIELIDVKANLWSLKMVTQATGTVANPIS